MENTEFKEVSEAKKQPRYPRVKLKAEVIKRGETWLYVKETLDFYKNENYDEGAAFLISIAKSNEVAVDIKEGRTYEFLLDLSVDMDRSSKEVKPKFWLKKFRQSEF